MIINDLDGYYIVFDTKNWNTELDTLIVLSNNTIIYQERRDNIEVNTLSFERNGIHWKILMFCNEKVRSITETLEHFKATSETDIKDTITALYSQGLLYYSIFREECVSIINTNKII